jgi:Fe-S-cluster containining protein
MRRGLMQELLNKITKNQQNAPKLYTHSTFKFACRKGISCFNKCCGDLEIFLSPLDVVKLRNRLGITSGRFLSEYADIVIPDSTFLPFIKLKLDESGRCRFVSDEGCTVYEDRPLACRYYPLGFGAVLNRNDKGEEFCFLIRENHCEGFEEDREWSVQKWKEDQGIIRYDDANKDWVDLILHKKLRAGNLQPDEKSMKMFFMASYDIDAFRDFVFGSRFLEIYDIDEDILDLIKSEEIELVKFAHRWLKYVLFKETTVFMSEEKK